MSSTALAEDVLVQLDATLEHFNGNHADTLLLLARFAAGCPEADDAEAVAIDAAGIDLAVRVHGERRRARLDFPSTVATLADVQAQFFGRLDEARATAGSSIPLTSLERELDSTATLPTFITGVAEVRSLTPNLREVVFAGGLDAFEPVGADQFLYLMVPRPGAEPIPADHTMAVQMEAAAADPDDAPFGAYYTVRSWDADARRLTMWMVLHEHGAGVGAWAAGCEPGDRVAMWGPREGMGARADARSHLLVADESGVAAVAAIVDELPADARGHVIVETVDADHVVDLPIRPDLQVTWLFRGVDEPGTVNRLLDAVRSLDLDPGDVTDGLVAFGAAESRQVTAIRKHLRTELGMSAQDVYMTGYWRR